MHGIIISHHLLLSISCTASIRHRSVFGVRLHLSTESSYSIQCVHIEISVYGDGVEKHGCYKCLLFLWLQKYVRKITFFSEVQYLVGKGLWMLENKRSLKLIVLIRVLKYY